MKSLNVPFLENLYTDDLPRFEAAMESGAAKAFIDTVCWPEDYPYFPSVSFSVARSQTHLGILFNVRGFDLRAHATENNGNVWEDSCCEFFVSDPQDGTYYNFEMNCIGTMLASKRRNRNDFTLFTDAQLDRIVRLTSLEKGRAIEGESGIFSWRAAMGIPFDLIGIGKKHLPSSLRANFYKCGDKTAHPHFLSWNPVKTSAPDFHRPEFFGELKLV